MQIDLLSQVQSGPYPFQFSLYFKSSIYAGCCGIPMECGFAWYPTANVFGLPLFQFLAHELMKVNTPIPKSLRKRGFWREDYTRRHLFPQPLSTQMTKAWKCPIHQKTSEFQHVPAGNRSTCCFANWLHSNGCFQCQLLPGYSQCHMQQKAFSLWKLCTKWTRNSQNGPFIENMWPRSGILTVINRQTYPFPFAFHCAMYRACGVQIIIYHCDTNREGTREIVPRTMTESPCKLCQLDVLSSGPISYLSGRL